MQEKKRNPGKQDAEAAEQTRRQIIGAAAQKFAAKGFKAASLREIASSAGTAHGLIRHHFGTKEDLWKAVVDDYIVQMAARHLPLLQQAATADPLDLLKGFVSNFIRQTAESPVIAKLLVKDCSEPGPHLEHLVARIMPVHHSITPIFEQVKQAGYFPEHDAESFFIFLVALGSLPFTLNGFTNEFYHEDINSEAGVEAHIKRVLATLFGNRNG
ncbi:MAG: TetR/AcrR family transcriptional regulator [Pseudomonadota bacterium]